MAKTYGGIDQIKKVFIGSDKYKKIYVGTDQVYSASHMVTFHFNTNDTEVIEIEDGADALLSAPSLPSTYTGWTLLGWREDTTASSTVLSTKVVTTDGVHLYAVLRKTLTLYYNGNGSSSGSVSNQTGYQYFNCGNYNNPSFTIKSNGYSRTSYRFTGWGLNQATTVNYQSGNTIQLSSNGTLYAIWELIYHTVIFHFNTNDTRSVDVVDNTDALLKAPSLPSSYSQNGWGLLGWRNDTTASSSVLSTRIVTTDGVHIYAVLRKTLTLSYNGNGGTGDVGDQSGYQYFNCNNYNNPSFTVQGNGYTKTEYKFTGWGLNQATTVNYQPGNNVTINSNSTMYVIWELAYEPDPSKWNKSWAYMIYDGNKADSHYQGGGGAWVTWGGPRYVSQVVVFVNKWATVAYGYEGTTYVDDQRTECEYVVYGINDANNPSNRTEILRKTFSVQYDCRNADQSNNFNNPHDWLPVNGTYAGIWIEAVSPYSRETSPGSGSWRTYQFSRVQLPF